MWGYAKLLCASYYISVYNNKYIKLLSKNHLQARRDSIPRAGLSLLTSSLALMLNLSLLLLTPSTTQRSVALLPFTDHCHFNIRHFRLLAVMAVFHSNVLNGTLALATRRVVLSSTHVLAEVRIILSYEL